MNLDFWRDSEEVNPVIRGWANYHQHCAAKETFDRVDHEIWRALWQWARRRHPKKSRAWVKKQCFPALGQRAWTFATETDKRTPDDKPIWLRLVYAGETKIRRHVKIRRDANPFDPTVAALLHGTCVPQEVRPHAPKSRDQNRCETGSAHAGLWCGLSRMRRKSHVRF